RLRRTARPPASLLPLFFFNAPPPPEIYTLSLHDALPISSCSASSGWTPPYRSGSTPAASRATCRGLVRRCSSGSAARRRSSSRRSEEHTSELQSRENLVCRLLLEKKKKNTDNRSSRDCTL